MEQKLNLKIFDQLFDQLILDDQKFFINEYLPKHFQGVNNFFWLYQMNPTHYSIDRGDIYKGVIFAKNRNQALKKLTSSETFQKLFCGDDKKLVTFCNGIDHLEGVCFFCKKKRGNREPGFVRVTWVNCFHSITDISEDSWFHLGKQIFDDDAISVNNFGSFSNLPISEWSLNPIQNFLC